MNKERRKKLKTVCDLLEQALETLETVQEEEQESFDNLPEGIQQSEKGEAIEENAYRLDDIIVCIEDQLNEIEDICGGE